MKLTTDIGAILPPHTGHLIVFDGLCVLCNGFARFVARHDKNGLFRFTTAQGPLGQQLYAALDLPTDDFQTNLVIIDGIAHCKMASFAAVMTVLGWPWRFLSVVNAMPIPVADWLYDRIARNRYRLFGQYRSCPLPTRDMKERLL